MYVCKSYKVNNCAIVRGGGESGAISHRKILALNSTILATKKNKRL